MMRGEEFVKIISIFILVAVGPKLNFMFTAQGPSQQHQIKINFYYTFIFLLHYIVLIIRYYICHSEMAGGRRNTKSGSFKHHSHSSDDRHGCDLPTQPQVIPPKHIPIPEIPNSSDLSFEFEALILCIFAMLGQYINLFRSVFWLPNSYSEYALNYYLIDYNIMALNMIILGRRLPVHVFKELCSFFFPIECQPLYMFCIHIVTLMFLCLGLIFCSIKVVLDHGLLSILFLTYPFVVYVIVLGANTYNFLDLTPYYVERSSNNSRNNNKNGGVNQFSYPPISHTCSMTAEAIREEVETMRSDFNYRLRQVLFNTFIVVYFSCFMPCCFAPSALYYDLNYVVQHSAFACIGCLTFYMCHVFPPKYYDLLHRAALHLGRWQHTEVKNSHIPYSIWTESAVWNQGAIVKHSKELFKAEWICNAAEPGHNGQYRFYKYFKDPSLTAQVLWLLQILILLTQIFIISQSTAWHEFISMQLLVMVNCKALYVMTRSFFVVNKIYNEEAVLTSKFSN